MKNSLQWHRATIQSRRDLCTTVREFEIRPEDGVPPWTVGSHLSVRVLAAGREDTRSYSLVGLPQNSLADGIYRIAVQRAEPGRGGSRFMWGLVEGDDVMIGEPINDFELPLNAPEYLLVAGGIGVTPLLGMAQQLARRGARVQMRYAARKADDLVYASELRDALGARLRTFCAHQGQRMDLAAEVAALVPGAHLLVCGPVSMLDAARATWAGAGRDVAALHFETFGSSGQHEAQAFWVELPRHGLRIEVPADRSLLDALCEAGVDVLSDCRRGECGLCAMDIISAEGTIDHRDVFLSPDEKRSGRSMCACVSRINGGGVVLDSAYRPD